MLDNALYFEYKNYSVPKDDPIHNAPNAAALEAAIEAQIKPVSAVLVVAGVYSSYSKWIDKEISIAQKLQKPIIAIRPRGNEYVSDVATSNANMVVSWNTNSIVGAIRDLT